MARYETMPKCQFMGNGIFFEKPKEIKKQKLL